MLSKVTCALFNQRELTFTNGLNVILGDDDATNSIGKSSALMVIDFAMGGNSLIDDKAGLIKANGDHFYHFEFIFSEVRHFFIRSTSSKNIVQLSNEKSEILGEIPLAEYTELLKNLYRLNDLNDTFRSIVGPFSRIWGRGTLDPQYPASGGTKETLESAISRLIVLFKFNHLIENEKIKLSSVDKKKSLIKKSMNAEIIPSITKAKYQSNEKIINKNTESINLIKKDFLGAQSVYDALFDEDLRNLQKQLINYTNQRNTISSRISRLERDLEGVTTKLSENISLIHNFFPEINLARLQAVELFHQNISKLVKNELKSDLAEQRAIEHDLDEKIDSLNGEIRATLDSKGTPDDLFSRAFELKEIVDSAANENKYYEKKLAVEEESKLFQNRLNEIYEMIFSKIEERVNLKLRRFNKIVYGPKRNPSQLKIKNQKSYSFISPEDTGTGKYFAGLVGFDISMLLLTELPFIIHDSIIYKNIEIQATRNILFVLSAIRKKQIFLAFDEAKKFGSKTERLLHNHASVELSHTHLLYKMDWRGQHSEKLSFEQSMDSA